MKKRLMSVIAFAVAFAGFAFTAPTANADTTDDIAYNYTTNAAAKSLTSAKAKSKAKAATTADGRLILAYIMEDGLPKGQRKNCTTIPAGTPITTNLHDSLRDNVWIKRKSRGEKACKTGSGWKLVKCGNRVFWVKSPAPKRVRKNVFKGKYKEVRKQKLRGTATAVALGSSTSSVMAVQNTGPCTGSYATASGAASFKARATATFTARSKRKLKAKFKATQGRLEVKAADKAKGKASTLAEGYAKTNVSASITCNVPETPTPPTPAPSVLEITTVNDVVINNTRTLSVVGSTAPGHTGTLFCTAGTGTITAGKSQSVSGNFTKQITYKAPSEVPSSGKDSVSCTLTQDDGQTATISSNQFDIRGIPPESE